MHELMIIFFTTVVGSQGQIICLIWKAQEFTAPIFQSQIMIFRLCNDIKAKISFRIPGWIWRTSFSFRSRWHRLWEWTQLDLIQSQKRKKSINTYMIIRCYPEVKRKTLKLEGQWGDSPPFWWKNSVINSCSRWIKSVVMTVFQRTDIKEEKKIRKEKKARF